MKSIRIGKDIALDWEIMSNGEKVPLNDKDLYIELRYPGGKKKEIEQYEIEDINHIHIGLRGTALGTIGTYTLTLWENKGKLGQCAVDSVDAFRLVKFSQDETNPVGLAGSSLTLSSDLTFLTSGLDGYTPIRGVDYLTEDDWDVILERVEIETDLSLYAKKTEVPTKTSELLNDSGFLGPEDDSESIDLKDVLDIVNLIF